MFIWDFRIATLLDKNGVLKLKRVSPLTLFSAISRMLHSDQGYIRLNHIFGSIYAAPVGHGFSSFAEHDPCNIPGKHLECWPDLLKEKNFVDFYKNHLFF
jgi:hypothetical protein